jgi:FkbM family methyltransferase
VPRRGLEGISRWVYVHLPEFLHDTPSSRLRAYFAGVRRVTFVEIGAYDGKIGDPLRPLILANDGWSGVMVEPQPDAFERLQRNYSAQASRLQFLNVAISDRAGENTLFYNSDQERECLRLPVGAGQLASLSSEHLSKHFTQATPTRHQARPTTFTETAGLLPSGHVDIVAIDAEGHEWIIIETIDLERHRVKFILYEHRHLSEPDRSAIEIRLRKHGYWLLSFCWDTIAWLPLGGDRPRQCVGLRS